MNGAGGGSGPISNHNGGKGGTADGNTRRNDRMRRELIHQTLGKRNSIGTKRFAKSLVPLTPRRGPGYGTGGRSYSGQFELGSHAEED